MNHPPPTEKQTGKRIVTKGRYVQVQGIRAVLGVLGTGMLLLTVLCGFATMVLLLRLVLGLLFGLDLINFWVVFTGGLAALIFGGATYLLGKGSLVSIRQAQKLGEFQPLTRANTPALPAPDSLVRASAEPVQEQQAVLLRAATEGGERHEEQLVRAAAGGTE